METLLTLLGYRAPPRLRERGREGAGARRIRLRSPASSPWLRPTGQIVPSLDAAASIRALGLQSAKSRRILEIRRAWLARGHGAASWRDTGGGEHARWAGVAAKLCGPV